MIDHNHIIDLLPAYALNCLDDDEAVMVAEHLAACEKCHSRLTEYRQSVDLLAHGTPRVSPPDKLKIELMRRIYATLNATPGAPGKSRPTPPPWRQASWWSHFSPVWAIAGLIMIVGLAAVNLVQWHNSSRSFQTEAPVELLIIKMKGTARAPEGDGTFVISRDRKQGVLVASDLPVPDESHQYQLWMVKDGQRINGGIFSVRLNGYATVKIYANELLTNFRSFEVTLEPSGGSPKSGEHLVMVSRH